jgi:hypothetical protein
VVFVLFCLMMRSLLPTMGLGRCGTGSILLHECPRACLILVSLSMSLWDTQSSQVTLSWPALADSGGAPVLYWVVFTSLDNIVFDNGTAFALRRLSNGSYSWVRNGTSYPTSQLLYRRALAVRICILSAALTGEECHGDEHSAVSSVTRISLCWHMRAFICRVAIRCSCVNGVLPITCVTGGVDVECVQVVISSCNCVQYHGICSVNVSCRGV